jgi:hypothetical protein
MFLRMQGVATNRFMSVLLFHRWGWNVASIALAVGFVWMVSTPQTAAAKSLSNHCPGDITYEGNCTGDVLQWCENGEIIQIDCSEQGSVCAWSDSKDFYTCMDANPVQNECEIYGNLTWSGDCLDGHTLVWCSNGSIETLVCQEGMSCGWDASAQEYNCMGDSFSEGSAGSDGGAEPSEGGEEEQTGGEESTESQDVIPPVPSARNDDDDIAEQAQVIRGNSPPSNGKEDDSQPSFFEATEGEPSGGCSTANPIAPGGILIGMGMFLWFRSRERSLS